MSTEGDDQLTTTDPVLGPDLPRAPAPSDPERTNRGPVLLAGGLAAVFLVAAVILGALAGNLNDEVGKARDDPREVRQVSAGFAAHLLTFDYRHLEAYRSGVLHNVTGKVRNEFTQAYAGFKELATTGQTVSRGTVTDVFVGEIERGNATVVAVVSTSATGKAGTRAPFDSYIQLDLVKVEGHWMINGVTNLNFTEAAPTPGSESPSTTSTTPPK